MFNKQETYRRLCGAAAECRLCPNVFHDLTYLNEKNGNIESRIMFVGEAPGFVRDPKERGMAFHGNQSGHNFEHLLRTIGLRREDVFVTNALLHTPVTPANREFPGYGLLQIRGPKSSELENCSRFLRDQVKLIDPRVIVTIGSRGLAALQLCFPEDFPIPISLREDAATAVAMEKSGRFLFPIYHTSPNVTASIRSLQKMEEDFTKLGGLLQFLNIL